MNKVFVFVAIIFLSLLVVGCSSGQRDKSADVNVSKDCQISKSMHQICIGNCLMVTPGETLTALGICGNKCTKEFVEMSVYCNRS